MNKRTDVYMIGVDYNNNGDINVVVITRREPERQIVLGTKVGKDADKFIEELLCGFSDSAPVKIRVDSPFVEEDK